MTKGSKGFVPPEMALIQLSTLRFEMGWCCKLGAVIMRLARLSGLAQPEANASGIASRTEPTKVRMVACCRTAHPKVKQERSWYQEAQFARFNGKGRGELADQLAVHLQRRGGVAGKRQRFGLKDSGGGSWDAA